MKCLVSGATGFIGSELCRQLLARGDSIIALSRTGSALPDGTPTVAFDLALQTPAVDLLRDVEVVFHLAGIAHQRAADEDYENLNYQATLRLARQAAAAGVRRFVFLSSVKAMGPVTGTGARSEGDVNEPRDAYGQSKLHAERGLTQEFASGPMTVVILRPALVYGPGAKGNLQLLARAVKLGLPRPPEGGGRSMVALQDLCELLCISADIAGEGVRLWIAADGEAYTTRAISDLLRRSSGKTAGTTWLPRWCWRLAAGLLDLRSPRSGESTYQKLFGEELYSSKAVCTATDWRPQYTLADYLPQLLARPGELQ